MTHLLLSYCWQQFAKQRTNNVGTNSVRPFSSPTWFMETQTSQLPEAGRRGRRPLQLRYGREKKRCRVFAPTPLCFVLYFYMLFNFFLHLVGLRRLRLCLKLWQGFALYPQGVSPLDPDQGRAPGPFARYARFWILLHAWSLLWSAMPIPHSSLITLT